MPGESSKKNGRKGGRPVGRLGISTLMAIKTKEEFIKKVNENLQPIFDALLKKAESGDVAALREILDRAWGKPVQPLAGDKKNPLVFLPLELMEKYKLKNENSSSRTIEDSA